jgi:uncharacterized protein YrrD
VLIQAKDVLNKPVFAQDIEDTVGIISDIIVDPENGKIVAFSVARFLQKPKIVSEVDVLDLTQDGLLINSENALVFPSELVRIKEIIDRGIKIINSKAVTESKKSLGIIEDFLIDTETAGVVKFYIKGGLLSPSVVLPIEKVVKIEKGKIIFSDDILERKEVKEAVPA